MRPDGRHLERSFHNGDKEPRYSRLLGLAEMQTFLQLLAYCKACCHWRKDSSVQQTASLATFLMRIWTSFVLRDCEQCSIVLGSLHRCEHRHQSSQQVGDQPLGAGVKEGRCNAFGE